MGWPVILTQQSLDDLHDIVVFIAQDDRDAARRFGNQLIDAALSIGTFPEMGRVVPEFRDESVREITQGAYRIVYEVLRDPTVVYVHRFWHAARGVPAIPRA